MTGKPRYQQMAEAFGLTAQEQLTAAATLHVSVASDEAGVAALDRIQPWLAPLLALSANSPFWHGTDSSYASFRYQAWRPLAVRRAHRVSSLDPDLPRAVERTMVATGTVLDTGMVYFDTRLSQRLPDPGSADRRRVPAGRMQAS